MMEMVFPQAKRIKLEHSYAYFKDNNPVEPVRIKEEDPLKLTEYVDIPDVEIKIEVDEGNDNIVVKSEPVDEENTGTHSFEYFSVPNNDEIETLPHSSFDSLDKVQNVDSCTNESATSVDNPLSDPLELVQFEYVWTENGMHCEKNEPSKNGAMEEASTNTKSASTEQLQKDKENLQNQIKKLTMELKDTKAREKALQTELGARRMSELSLRETIKEQQKRLQEDLKKDTTQAKRLKDITQRLVVAERESAAKSYLSEKTQKAFTEKLERTNAELKKKSREHKYLDLKCANLTHTVARLTAQCDAHKVEIDQLNQKLVSSVKSLSSTVGSTQAANRRIAALNEQLTAAQKNNEDLQKALLTEKKMCRFFLKERDQLLELQDGKYKETEKELSKLKLSVGSLTAALTLKVNECRAQKTATNAVLSSYQKKNLKLKVKEDELEKKRQELEKKSCEYCGF